MRKQTRELIETLIGFDTTSRETNLPLIEFVRDYLDGLGIASELTYDDDRRKANLFATIGPADVPGVVLSGHTDVVPVDGQSWDSDPFAVKEIDGRLFGRGTADMKSFIAVALAMVPDMLQRSLQAPLHLSFSYDEEVGCIGVHRLLEQVARMAVKPYACIVGEPTGMQVINAHKGKKSMRCRVRGKAAHSSLTDQGVNAVEVAGELITYLRRMSHRLRDEGPHNAAFQPNYTTVHTGVVSGGTALNIVPEACEFEFEIRNLPEQEPEALCHELREFAEQRLLPDMHAVDSRSGIDWDPMPSYPALACDEDSDIVRLVKRLSRSNVVGTVSFGTEAGLFQETGIPAVICGPGSIEQAHKPNEYISVAQVDECERFVSRLLDEMGK